MTYSDCLPVCLIWRMKAVCSVPPNLHSQFTVWLRQGWQGSVQRCANISGFSPSHLPIDHFQVKQNKRDLANQHSNTSGGNAALVLTAKYKMKLLMVLPWKPSSWDLRSDINCRNVPIKHLQKLKSLWPSRPLRLQKVKTKMCISDKVTVWCTFCYIWNILEKLQKRFSYNTADTQQDSTFRLKNPLNFAEYFAKSVGFIDS